MAKKEFKKNQDTHRINDEINNVTEVRVVTDEIKGVVMPIGEAMRIAQSQSMDLIEINARTTPPIVTIEPYDKFLYNLKKNAKKATKNKQSLKEVQLTVNIAENDLKTKANRAIEFLNHGDKVKVVLTMKGRELTRREENKKSIFMFLDMISEIGVPESMPKDEGNRTSVIVKKKTGK